MGGSLALALRGQCASISGYDPDSNAISLALEKQIVSYASQDLRSVLERADLVILAAPVLSIISCLHDLPDLLPQQAIIMDIGSTKKDIVEAMATLPPRFDPIGGHPMCGKETSSLRNAEAALFHGKPFVLVPLLRTSPHAQMIAKQLVEAVEAHPLIMDAPTHDQWTAVTSHLPYLLSSALVLSTPLEVAPLIGPGYRSTTRLALSSPNMMVDVLVTNRVHLLQAIARFRIQLDELEKHIIQDEDQKLRKALTDVVAQFTRLTQNLQS